jgi:hypothetical protein
MNTNTVILQKIEMMPEHLKQEVLQYVEQLIEKYSQTTSLDKAIPNHKRRLFGSMKGTFVLPLPDNFNDELDDFQDDEKKYGYGSLAGKIIMSDDFDEPLEDLKDYM